MCVCGASDGGVRDTIPRMVKEGVVGKIDFSHLRGDIVRPSVDTLGKRGVEALRLAGVAFRSIREDRDIRDVAPAESKKLHVGVAVVFDDTTVPVWTHNDHEHHAEWNLAEALETMREHKVQAGERVPRIAALALVGTHPDEDLTDPLQQPLSDIVRPNEIPLGTPIICDACEDFLKKVARQFNGEENFPVIVQVKSGDVHDMVIRTDLRSCPAIGFPGTKYTDHSISHGLNKGIK